MKKMFYILLYLIMIFGLAACGFTTKTITIQFDANGGTPVADREVDSEAPNLSLPTTTKEGYTFLGWYADYELLDEFLEDQIPIDNITLYAKWEANEYTMTFASNSGTPVSAIKQDYSTVILEPAEPTRKGYTFIDWYSDSGLTTAYEFSTMPAENITLYAKWIHN